MPENERIVLLTGVNGYLGSVIAKAYLDNGYSVRGTVRSKERALKLLRVPFRDNIDEGKFTVYEVPDIELPGAFDKAVEGACL